MRKADNLPPSCAVVTKSGNLNFLEPSGPVQACNGTALPFTLVARTRLSNYVIRILHAKQQELYKHDLRIHLLRTSNLKTLHNATDVHCIVNICGCGYTMCTGRTACFWGEGIKWMSSSDRWGGRGVSVDTA